MTRWSPMTRTNFVGTLPYHLDDPKILNGASVTKPFLSHASLMGGGHLDFTMNATRQAWGGSAAG
jgi:putative alpha-1,2-mannosidase